MDLQPPSSNSMEGAETLLAERMNRENKKCKTSRMMYQARVGRPTSAPTFPYVTRNFVSCFPVVARFLEKCIQENKDAHLTYPCVWHKENEHET